MGKKTYIGLIVLAVVFMLMSSSSDTILLIGFAVMMTIVIVHCLNKEPQALTFEEKREQARNENKPNYPSIYLEPKERFQDD